jgi:CRISPR-associated exonuclease Cas4
MKIRELTIHNWRSIHELSLSAEDLMIFIGQNNHGKSNILSAILFFFGEIPLDVLDFYRDREDLFVEVLFSELDDGDRTTFKKYVTTENNIRVRKEATKDCVFTYHGYVEVPEEDWLKEENISNYIKREDAETLPLAELLPDSGRITKDAFRQAQEKYINQNREDLIFSYELEAGPFLGAKNVAKGIFGDVYFVPSVKKAEDDVSLMRILNRMNEDGTENIARPTELSSFEESINIEIENWNTTIDVDIIPPDINDIFKVGTKVWVNDGIRTDVGRKGQGLQRALIFALVRSLAKLMRQEREEADGAEASAQGFSSRQASRSWYFILEEPELYLHPQAQRELFDSLVKLSSGESQVLLCTHSSSFISLKWYHSICVVRKNSIEEGTTVLQCTEELFPEEEDKNLFNMTYWINPDRGELFFAKKVVLVEGPTDKTVLPQLANKLNVFRHEYTIIDCGSKDAIPNYLRLLNRFKIPYVVVYDKDHQTSKSPDAILSADRSSQKIESNVDSALGKTIILENDIEEEIGILEPEKKNKPYIAVAHVCKNDFIMSDSLQAKVESIYVQ